MPQEDGGTHPPTSTQLIPLRKPVSSSSARPTASLGLPPEGSCLTTSLPLRPPRWFVVVCIVSAHLNSQELVARQLYQCLIDYTSPLITDALRASGTTLRASGTIPAPAIFVGISRPELPLNDQIAIIAACRLAVFSAAWAVTDYMTMLELLQGKQIDQLTKARVRSWVEGAP